MATELRTSRLGDSVGYEHVQGIRMSPSFAVRDKARHLQWGGCRHALQLDEDLASVSIEQNYVGLVWPGTFHNGQAKVFHQINEDASGLRLF